jgi:LmbE family N-acetylglucosaminyl deacetylase
MAATVILSPHPDDAVLSLWHLLTSAEDVLVLNVFGGSPDGHRGDGWWDTLTRATDSVERIRERHAEDREALALAGRVPENLGFLDGQYRHAEQPVEPIAEAIAAAVDPDALLLAPAALDAHRDHGLVRAAALALRDRGLPPSRSDRGHRVALYADVPHANVYGWPTWVTGEAEDPYLDPAIAWDLTMNGTGVSLAELNPDVHALDDAAETAKRDAVLRYRTQVPALDAQYSLLRRPEVLRYEVVWPLS